MNSFYRQAKDKTEPDGSSFYRADIMYKKRAYKYILDFPKAIRVRRISMKPIKILISTTPWRRETRAAYHWENGSWIGVVVMPNGLAEMIYRL